MQTHVISSHWSNHIDIKAKSQIDAYNLCTRKGISQNDWIQIVDKEANVSEWKIDSKVTKLPKDIFNFLIQSMKEHKKNSWPRIKKRYKTLKKKPTKISQPCFFFFFLLSSLYKVHSILPRRPIIPGIAMDRSFWHFIKHEPFASGFIGLNGKYIPIISAGQSSRNARLSPSGHHCIARSSKGQVFFVKLVCNKHDVITKLMGQFQYTTLINLKILSCRTWFRNLPFTFYVSTLYIV